MKFVIDKQVFEKLPGIIFGVVVAHVDNRIENPDISKLLLHWVEARREELEKHNLKDHPDILPYREAFAALSMNPNKYMCSIEALCKRVQKGNGLPSINPVVDIGNAVSLKYMLPIGAHDLDKINADFAVRFSVSNDLFTPFGSDRPETPEPGELIYVSGNTVKTRRWIWRQSEDGKIEETSSHILFPIDGFETCLERVTAARDELCALIHKHFGVSAEAGLLNSKNREMTLQDID